MIKVLLLSALIVAAKGQNGVQPGGVQSGFNNNNPQAVPQGFQNGQSPFNNNNQPGFQAGTFNGQPNPAFTNANGQGGFGFGQGQGLGPGPQGTFESSQGPSGSGQYQGPNGGWSYSYNTSDAKSHKVVNVWTTLLAICVGGLLRQSV